MTQDEAFKAWWYSEGSQPPYTHHDCEEHTMRMCEIAWANGAYKERETLAQTQEPVAWQFFEGGKWHNGMEVNDHRKHTEAAGVPVRDLYTTPPQRSESSGKPSAWVGLTDEEICTFSMWLDDKSDVAVFTAIEAKLKEMNT